MQLNELYKICKVLAGKMEMSLLSRKTSFFRFCLKIKKNAIQVKVFIISNEVDHW